VAQFITAGKTFQHTNQQRYNRNLNDTVCRRLKICTEQTGLSSKRYRTYPKEMTRLS